MEALRFIVCAIITIIVFIPFFLRTISNIKPIGIDMLEDAKREGREVTGYLIKETYIHRQIKKSREKHPGYILAIYEYTINNKKYHYEAHLEESFNKLQKEVKLYYPKGKPHKAVFKEELASTLGGKYTMYVLSPVIFLAIIYNISGMFFS